MDLFPAVEIVLDTREGEVTCTIVETELDQPELTDCRNADGKELTEQEMRDLGLKTD